MNEVLFEMKIAAQQAPRLYFAPFLGAVNAMRKEIRALRRSRNQSHTKSTDSKSAA